MEDRKLRITFESYGRKIVLEGSEDSCAEEFVEMCFGGGVGLTFLPQSILTAMRDYSEGMLEAMEYEPNGGMIRSDEEK